MAWVRIDDQFASHPKVIQAGPLGMAMQVAALCYSNRYLTDGFIPRAVVPTLLNLEGLAMRVWQGELIGGGQDATWQLVVQDLLAAGLWEEVEGGYQIHDYLDYQLSREEVIAEREQKREAGRRGGLATAQARAVPPAQAPAVPPAQAESEQVLEQNASTCSSETPAEAQAESKPIPIPIPMNNITSCSDEHEGALEGADACPVLLAKANSEPRGESKPSKPPPEPQHPPPLEPELEKTLRLFGAKRFKTPGQLEAYRYLLRDVGPERYLEAVKWAVGAGLGLGNYQSIATAARRAPPAKQAQPKGNGSARDRPGRAVVERVDPSIYVNPDGSPKSINEFVEVE